MSQETYEITKKGAEMDYNEHESTYSIFILLVKWGIIFNVALLCALFVGFFTFAGLFGGLFVFFAMLVAAKFIFHSKQHSHNSG